MPKVSVIIPVYGVEKYIERCAQSLFKQTLDDIEYLFINDCTPDNSIEILKKVIEEYPQRKGQVVIHRMEKNSGQAAVRTWGMKNATGDYVIQCDSDDWVDQNAYKSMYETAVAENADVCVCGYQTHDGNKTLNTYRGVSHTTNIECINDFLLQKNSWSLCNKLYKRDLFSKVEQHPKRNMGEDMALTMQLFYFCKRISFVNLPYYYYYVNQESISKKPGLESCLKRFYDVQENTNIVLDFYESKEDRNNYKNSLLFLKLFCIKKLWPVLEYDKKYYKLWDDTFQGITVPLLLNGDISTGEKIRFLLTNVRLYPKHCIQRR